MTKKLTTNFHKVETETLIEWLLEGCFYPGSSTQNRLCKEIESRGVNVDELFN